MSKDTKSSEFAKLEPLIKLSDALIGGTRLMRAAGQAYLPIIGNQDSEDYKKKIAVAVLYPAYAETVKQMSGRVFFKPVNRANIAIDETYLEDFNMNNDDIDSFLTVPFRHALSYSRAYVLVTAPNSEGVTTRAEEKANNIRPYAVVIHPSQVLGIKREQGKIVEFRYKSQEIVTNSEYEEEMIERVIIHTPGKADSYVKSDDDYLFESTNEIKNNGGLLEKVPVCELVFEKDELPLEHLAYLNVKHWQSQSDQDNILEICRKPTLLITGNISPSEVVVGESIVVDEDVEAKWIESSGSAISAGQESLDKLEAQMQAAGAKLLTRTKLSMTDSQAKEEQSKEISQLRLYANLLEDFCEKILYFFALFEGKEDGGTIEISGNIDADFDSSASMDRVNEGVKSGYVSPQTAFEELQRRAMISEGNDWETEQVRLSAQSE